MNQARLRCLQIAQRGLGGVSCGADRLLGPFALGDVGVDQHEAAARHRAAANFNDAPVRSGALEAQFPVGVLKTPVQFPFDVVGPELAAFDKNANIFDIGRAFCDHLIGQVQDRLEIAVPRNKARVSAKHRNTVAHIVEGDTQLRLSVAQFLEQPRILDRDHRLIGEAGGQLDLFFRKGFDARAANDENADERVLAKKRNAEDRAGADELLFFAIGVFRVLQYIGNVDRATLQRHTAPNRTSAGRNGMSAEIFPCILGKSALRDAVIDVAATAHHIRMVGAAKARYRFHERVKNRFKVDRRAADDLEHVAGRGLPLQRFAGLGQEPHVLDGYHSLVGESGNQGYLLFSKKLDALAREYNDAD